MMRVPRRIGEVSCVLRNWQKCLWFLSHPGHHELCRIMADAEFPLFDLNSGTTTQVERDALARLVTEANEIEGPVVEIGILFGFTTNLMVERKRREKRLVAVDSFCWNPWALSPVNHRKLCAEVLRLAVAHHHVEIVEADKSEFYRTWTGGAPSLVFLDAIHTEEETAKDIEWAVRAGAETIAGHDYSDEFPGVKAAVERFGKAEVFDRLWVLRRGDLTVAPSQSLKL